jgi:hypothetical protein
MPIVVSNLFDSAWVYQDLLDEVREAAQIYIFTPYSCVFSSSPNVVGHANDTLLGYRPPFDIPTCSFSIPLSGLPPFMTVHCYIRGHTCILVLSTYLRFQILLVS